MCAKRYCMPDPAVELTDRIILEEVPRESRVIDLGCGDGHLLQRLRDERNASVLGVELDKERVLAAIERGVPVVQADLDRGLQVIPSHGFDFAVLSQTLQQVRHPKILLQEMLRIAARAIVVVPNFGHWRIRVQVMYQGRAPVTEELPYQWYNTPNLHFMTMYDFRHLADQLHFQVVKELPIIGRTAVAKAWAANLRAESALYILQGRRDAHD